MNVKDLVASLLQQLVRRQGKVPNEMIELYRHHVARLMRPSLSECSSLLQSTVGAFSKVFVVLDALDECRENGTRNRLLLEIGKLRPKVHLLVTSRPNIWFDDNAVRLEILGRGDDIRDYVEYEMSGLQHDVAADPALRKTIIEKITENAQGMSVAQNS